MHVFHNSNTQVDWLPAPIGHKDASMDSGATKHIFHCRSQFNNFRTSNTHYTNGKPVKIIRIGDILHIAGLTYYLILKTQLENEGKCTFSHSRVRTVYHHPPVDGKGFGKVFLIAIQNDHNLFIVKPIYLCLYDSTQNYQAFDALVTKCDAMEILHKTLGHIHVERVCDVI